MRSSNSSSSSAGNSQACAACKYQRRKCAPNCLLAPYFPATHQKNFLNAHKLFGVSNITKTIKPLDPQNRAIAMKSIIYQANARANDPVGGCFRIISELQNQIHWAKAELDYVLNQLAICKAAGPPPLHHHHHHHHQDHLNSMQQDLQGLNVFDAFSLPPCTRQQQQQQQGDQLDHDHQQQQLQLQLEGNHNHHHHHNNNNIVVVQVEGTGNYEGGGSSSSSQVYNNVFDSDSVKVETEGQGQGQGQSHIVSAANSNIACCKPQPGLLDVGEDIKPLLASFDDKGTFPFDFKALVQCTSDPKVVPKDEVRSSQQDLKHDLKDAASLFTLTNGEG